MTRRLLVGALLVWAGCTDGSQGAVSVRWWLVDKTSGVNYDPRVQGDGTGPCECMVGDRNNNCPATYGWHIDEVQLMIVDPSTNARVDVAPFKCRERERTTDFTIAPGRYAVSLRAYSLPCEAPCDARDWPTPPPSLRDVKRGEITNLDIVEIGVGP